MKPVIVTSLEAKKLPRAILWALCFAYIAAGLLGRDPWSGDDALGFGIAHQMGMGALTDWIMPNIAGYPVVAEGPAPYWFGAALAKTLAWCVGSDAAVHSLLFRIATCLQLGLFFLAFWYGTYSLARRPEIQPNDPLSVSAPRIEVGRAIADSALLIALASIGLVARVHEFSAESFQVMLIGLFLLGTAEGLRHPLRAGLLVGTVLWLSLISRGLPVMLAMAMCLAGLPFITRQYRLVVRSFFGTLTVATAGLIGLWIILLTSLPQGPKHLELWWEWNLSSFGIEPWRTLPWLAKNALWFTWPAWPVAIWALIRWKGKRSEPGIAVPLTLSASFGLIALLSPWIGESQMLMIVAPLSMLAAFGLAGIRRSLVSFMDWFAVIVFSGFGLAVWAYWFAWFTGTPRAMANSATRFAAGFTHEGFGVAFVLGLLASIAWILVIIWRTSRKPRAIWRSVALSSGGMVLAWLLLMTLWLPVFNHRKTYTDLSQIISSIIPKDHRCVKTLGLSLSQRALFTQGHLRFEAAPYEAIQVSAGLQTSSDISPPNSACDYLLVEDRSNAPLTSPELSSGQWIAVWEGRRPSDRRERFRVFKKQAS